KARRSARFRTSPIPGRPAAGSTGERKTPRPLPFDPGADPQDPPLSSDSRPRREVITLSPPRASSEAPPSLSTVPAPPRAARRTPFAFGGLLPVGEEKRL